MIKIVTQLLLFLLPWKLRRFFLSKFFHFEIAKTAHIGYSIILAHKVILKEYARIGHLTFCKQIDLLEMDDYSNLGTRNYITGFSTKNPDFPHFRHLPNRKCVLKIGKHTGITSRHYFDCNGGIYIGDNCQIAGFETAFLTHSIDLKNNRQDAESIIVGNYSFIGTRCTLIKGATIPSYSVISACSLVNKKHTISNALYGGVPCRFIKSLENYKFFERREGKVY